MNFLRTIKNSIYSPGVYATVLTKSFKSSLGYFLLLVLLLTVIRVITLISPLLRDTPKVLQEFAGNVIDCYPENLEIKITNGQVTTNIEEPYFMTDCKGAYLAVIDTKTPFSSDKFEAYKVAAWITKDSVVYKKSDVETTTYSLTQIKDFKLNQQLLNSYYGIISPYVKFIGPILLIFAFIGLFLAYDFRLIYLLLLSSIIWLLSKIFKQALTYGQAYKVGLHAITLGLIVELIVSLTNRWTNFHGFQFMVSILTLGVVSLNLLLPKKST